MEVVFYRDQTLAAFLQNIINNPVVLGLLGRHEEVSVGVLLNSLHRLTGQVGQ